MSPYYYLLEKETKTGVVIRVRRKDASFVVALDCHKHLNPTVELVVTKHGTESTRLRCGSSECSKTVSGPYIDSIIKKYTRYYTPFAAYDAEEWNPGDPVFFEETLKNWIAAWTGLNPDDLDVNFT